MDGSLGWHSYHCIGISLRTFSDSHWYSGQGLRANSFAASHHHPTICNRTCAHPFVWSCRCGERLFGVGFWNPPQPLALWTHGNSYRTDFGLHADCLSRPRRSCGRSQSFNGRGSSNSTGLTVANLLERFFSADATRNRQRVSARLY